MSRHKILVAFDPKVDLDVVLKQVWLEIQESLGNELCECKNILLNLATVRVFELTGNKPSLGSICFAYLVYYFQEKKYWYREWTGKYLLDPTDYDNKILHDLKPKYRRLLITCFSENGRMMDISKDIVASAPEVHNPLFDFKFISHLGYSSHKDCFHELYS